MSFLICFSWSVLKEGQNNIIKARRCVNFVQGVSISSRTFNTAVTELGAKRPSRRTKSVNIHCTKLVRGHKSSDLGSDIGLAMDTLALLWSSFRQ